MSMLKNQNNLNKCGLHASCEFSFLLLKKSRPHTDDEERIKPAFDIYKVSANNIL